jgi:ketosteroid isomerase-like protein
MASRTEHQFVTRTLAFAALIVALISSRAAFPAPETDAALIEETYNSWLLATNARDIEWWSSYLAPDAWFMPPDAPSLDTREAILEYYLRSFADPNFSLDCQQLTVDVAHSKDMAWASGVCRATFTDMNGQKAAGKSRWFKVWLKQGDGSWKCRVNTWDLIDTGISSQDDDGST